MQSDHRIFWITSFGNREKVSFDHYLYNLALYAQIVKRNYPIKDLFSKTLLDKLKSNHFDIDLDGYGAKIVRLSLETISD